jgi:hypothetical protein
MYRWYPEGTGEGAKKNHWLGAATVALDDAAVALAVVFAGTAVAVALAVAGAVALAVAFETTGTAGIKLVVGIELFGPSAKLQRKKRNEIFHDKGMDFFFFFFS